MYSRCLINTFKMNITCARFKEYGSELENIVPSPPCKTSDLARKRGIDQMITNALRYTCCLPGGRVVKNLLAIAGDAGDTGSIPESGRFPGRGNGNPFHGGHKGSDTTERLSTCTHPSCYSNRKPKHTGKVRKGL